MISPFGSRAAPDPDDASPLRSRTPRRGSGGRGNEREMERFRHGPQELPSVEVNAELVKLFAQVSGDHNPYHLDTEYARNSRYQGQIGHGILTVVLALSELSRVLPSYVPEEIEIARFTAPVRFGDRVRAIVLSTERDRARWRLTFVVTNQDDVDILQGSMYLWAHTPEDGPTSWLQTLGSSLEESHAEALEWSHGVQPFPVRPAPQLQAGQTADYTAVVSEERLKANIVISKDSPWITQIFALEAIAQASADLAPGFILVGMEAGDYSRPFQLGESLLTRATVTRQGTLAHRPLDRIRIDMEVLDASGEVVCSGAVYKESEAPIGEAPHPTSASPRPGVEFLVPPNQRLLTALARLHLPPFLVIVDLAESAIAEEAIEAREAVLRYLKETSPEQRDSSAGSYVFLRPHSLRTPWAAGDLLEVVGQAGHLLDGVLLSDVRGPEEVRFADRILAGLEEARGWERGHLKLEVMIQQPEIARRAQELAEASPRLVGLVNALGAHLATPELAMIIVRAAQGTGVDMIDGTTRPSDDGRETALGAVRSAMMGLQRKWAFNPIQLNAVLNPKLYLSDRDMQRVAIAQEGIRRTLSHDPEQPTLWNGTRISRTPQPTTEGPFPLAQLQEYAAREKPLL